MRSNLLYPTIIFAIAGLSACNSGQTTSQNSPVAQSTTTAATKPIIKSINSDIFGNYHYYGVATSDSIQSSATAPQSNYFMIPNSAGVIIGKRDATGGSGSYYWGNNLRTTTSQPIFDAAFCPAIDGRAFGVIASHDMLGVISSSTKTTNDNPAANTFVLNQLSTGTSNITWSSVSCTQYNGDVYVALAGSDSSNNLWGATYLIKMEAIKDQKTAISSNEINPIVRAKLLFSQPNNFEERGDDFFKVSFVKYENSSNKPDTGILYSTAYGAYYTPQVGQNIVSLRQISAVNNLGEGDHVLIAAPTVDLTSAEEELTADEKQQFPLITFSTLGEPGNVEKFVFWGDGFTNMFNYTPTIGKSIQTIVADPLGNDVLNHASDPLEPVLSGHACTSKNHLCLFLLRNYSDSHTSSVLVGINSLQNNLVHTRDTSASYMDINNIPAGSTTDSVYTGIAAINDGSTSKFLMVGGQYGNLIERTCPSVNDCSQVVLKANLQQMFTLK